MDLLRTLTAARSRAAAAPQDPGAWAALAEVLQVADRGALDPDAGFQLAVDRWEALSQLVTLAPTAENLRAQVTCLSALSTRARNRGHADLAVALRAEQFAAARVWQRIDPAPEAAAALLVEGAQSVAEAALARGDREDAVPALVAMLEGLHMLAERTGKPEYTLQLAGVHLHLATVIDDAEAARALLLAARVLLDTLDAAGLAHPVQAQVRQQVEARLLEMEGT